MLRFLLSATLVLCLPSLAHAASHRLVVHPNTALTILSIAQGPDGLLWLGTTDGLYRFDGFHYEKITSFPFSSARFVGFTGDGSLWCGNFEGLARTRDNQFEIINRTEIASLSSHADGVFASLFKIFTHLGLDGSQSRLPFVARRDQTVDSSGRLWFVCGETKLACWIDPHHPEQLHSSALPGGYEFQQVAPDAQGRLWAADLEQAIRVEDGKAGRKVGRRRSQEGSRTGPLVAGRTGELWFVGESVLGLSSKTDFRDRADHDRFPPMSGLEDSRGHVWVASMGRGLVEWIPDPRWGRWFPEDFANEPTVQVVRDRLGALILVTQKNLYRYQAQEEKWSPMQAGGYRYESLFPLEGGGFLASTRQLGLVRLSAEGRIVERLMDPSTAADQSREIARDGRGRLWVGTKRELFQIEGQAGSLRLREQDLPGLRENGWEQAVDLEIDDKGRLWVGYADGIAWLDDHDQWRRLSTDQPVTSLRSFALAGDDIWVAHRRSGAFSRLHRKGDQWSVTLLSANAGYGPVDTDFLKRDSRGWIWRGSTDGVYVADGRHFAPGDWIHIGPENGLATKENNQYGFFEDTDGSVWIAGEEGVTHVQPDPSWFDAPRGAAAPQITRVEADGRVFLFPAPLPPALPSTTKILRIDVGSLQSPPFRDDPLQYRLAPLSKDWQPARDGALQFTNLPEDSYSLEVGYAGNGPSAIATYPFRIGSGGSRLSWFWMVGLLMVTGALVPMVRHAPGYDLAKFRIEKAVFLLRRRYSHHNYDSPSGALSVSNDYSGLTLSGRYRLSRIVSRGGFSVVYEARDPRDGAVRLAVKVLNRSASTQSWIRDRFAHEVAALRSVEHPGVVQVLDSWISLAGEPCLVMPFLDGPTLRAALSDKPFPPGRVARIVSQIGAALAEVHSRGIIHRDLKPENMILLWPGLEREQSVIIDFGTAGLRTGENELAATTLMAGSFHYMAPERLTGHYSAASDVFSFGVIILEMLTGKRLSDLSYMFSDPRFEAELEKTLGGNLSENLAKALAARLAPAFDPDPRRRPADVKTWSEEIAATLDQT